MSFWMKFWHGIDDDASDRPVQDLLSRLEGLAPTWTLYHYYPAYDPQKFHSDTVDDDDFTREECEHWVIDDSRDWHIKMTYVQDTPDGALTTTIYSTSNTSRIAVDIENGGNLLELLHFESEHSDIRGATKLGAKVNRFAVQYVRNWVRARVLPTYLAAKKRRTDRRTARHQEREVKLSELRRKYLP